jgi:peptide/nickel transport system substrate-binding protein
LTAKQVQIIASTFGASQAMFVMRVDKGPMADNRIRQAFRLLCDRQQLINLTLSGFAIPGNDIMAPGVQYYADDLVSTHDVAKARELFKEAGALGQTFTIETTNQGSITAPACTILAQQASEAGVHVKLKFDDPNTYFTSYNRFFGINLEQPLASLTSSYREYLTRNAPFGETHWGYQLPGGLAAEALIAEAIAAVDPKKAADLWHEVQLQQFNEGGYINWGNVLNVDGAAKNVRGLSESPGFFFNNFRLQDGWLE